MAKTGSGTELVSDAEALAGLFAGHPPDAIPPAPVARHKKARVREFYDQVNHSLSASVCADDAVFLNFGYLPDGRPRAARFELPRHWPNRNRADLVLELIGGCDLTGCDVLDVGCGRGGTIAAIDRWFDVAEIWGLDLSPAAIASCRRLAGPHVHFVHGDAERLPFLGGFFDVVVNLESACLYADVYAFFREVHRVLGPGGRFLYADLIPSAHLEAYGAHLRGLGMALEREQDVTANVLLSLDADAGRHAAVHGQEVGAAALDFFLATPGSLPYREIQQGRLSYRIWQLCKLA
jgi:phthiocerol/phenolphthiocerol synthesis type-I polyketide synthase E